MLQLQSDSALSGALFRSLFLDCIYEFNIFLLSTIVVMFGVVKGKFVKERRLHGMQMEKLLCEMNIIHQ